MSTHTTTTSAQDLTIQALACHFHANVIREIGTLTNVDAMIVSFEYQGDVYNDHCGQAVIHAGGCYIMQGCAIPEAWYTS